MEPDHIDPPSVPEPIFLADSRDRDTWLPARLAGVTATEAGMLASGSIASKRRLKAEKTGESPGFAGNAQTARGKRREEYIATEVLQRYGITPSGMLYASGADANHLATPDCYDGKHPLYGRVGAEIKSTTEDYSHHIPQKYLDQIIWGMHVTGASLWLFVWEPCDDSGQPILPTPALQDGVHFRWVHAADHADRLAKLIKNADDFIAWRDAGYPELTTDLPEHVEEALADFAAARSRKAEAEKAEKAATATVRAWIAEQPDMADGASFASEKATVHYTVTESDEFDAEAWAARAPRQASGYAAAQGRYRKPKRSDRLTITPSKAA